MLWLGPDVDADRDDFAPLIDKHVEYVPGSTYDQHPIEKAVSVRHHVSENVGTDEYQTTKLPREVGDNLPCLSVKYDARGLPKYAHDWCARMSLGRDGQPETNGIARFRRLGEYTSIADEMHEQDDE
jgi:hypothetical protein